MLSEIHEIATRAMMIIYLLLQEPRLSVGDLIKLPKDTEVLIDTSTSFNCSTTLSSKEIQWFHYNVGNEQERQLVYGFDQFHGTFQGRCRMERNEANGEHNLVIESVSIEDAGKFECQDDMGRGAKGSAQLSVLEAIPVCESSMKEQGLIGPNSCGIQQEDLHLTCTVDYRGNQPPHMIWRRSNSDQVFTDEVQYKKINDTRVTYSLTLMADDDIDGHMLECHTTKSATVQWGCNFGPIKIAGSNTVFISLVVVSMVLGVSVIVHIVSCTLRMNSRIKNRKGTGVVVPATDDVDHSEHHEMLHIDEIGLQQELNRLREECEHLRIKVSQYEDTIYTGGIRYKIKPELIYATSVQNGKEAINGITVLFDELFAIYQNCPDILVYDSITYRQQDKNPLHVDGPWYPQDIASCSTNKCLYIIGVGTDSAESHLLKIDPKRIKKLEIWHNFDCHDVRLSVYETNLIVCLPEKRVVKQLSAQAETLRTIRFSPGDGFDSLSYALQVTETNFILCDRNNDKKRQKLCLVDCDGKIIGPVNDEKKLKTAICLVNDSDKSVLVLLKDGKRRAPARRTKDLVLLLNHKLVCKRTLIEHSSDDCGVKMCLDSTGSRIFVAVNSAKSKAGELCLHSGRILFYNIK